MGILSGLSNGAHGLGNFGQWFSIFGDKAQDLSNKAQNYGQIGQAFTKEGLSTQERVGLGVEGAVDQAVTGKITNFLDRFMPRWVARGLGTWLGNKTGDVAGNLAESVTSKFTGNKDAKDTPNHSDILKKNGIEPGKFDVDGDGVPDNDIESHHGAVVSNAKNVLDNRDVALQNV